MARHLLIRLALAFAALLVLPASMSSASEDEHPVERHYPVFPPAPASQTAEQAQAKSAGCLSCHTTTDQLSMQPENSLERHEFETFYVSTGLAPEVDMALRRCACV